MYTSISSTLALTEQQQAKEVVTLNADPNADPNIGFKPYLAKYSRYGYQTHVIVTVIL